MALSLTDPTSPLGDMLLEAEKARGIGAGIAADLCKVSRSTYLYWKRGTRPKIKHLVNISAFCNEPPRVILAAIGLDVDEVYDLDAIPGYVNWDSDNPHLRLVATA